MDMHGHGNSPRTRVVVHIGKDPQVHNDAISFLVAATALYAMQDINARLGEWTVPMMVLHGDVDTYCNLKGSRKFLEGLGVKIKN